MAFASNGRSLNYKFLDSKLFIATRGPSPFCQNRGQVDCSDPYSIALYALLDLANSNGSTAAEVLATAQTICPAATAAWTDLTVETLLRAGAKRGLFSVIEGVRYVVNAGMCLQNPINAPYYCIMQLYQC